MRDARCWQRAQPFLLTGVRAAGIEDRLGQQSFSLASCSSELLSARLAERVGSPIGYAFRMA